MTLIVQSDATDLVVPASVRRRAGFKAGDQLEFRVSAHTITITTKEPSLYEPTRSELAAIRKGEAELARGESVTLDQLMQAVKSNVESRRRKVGTKTTRRVSRCRVSR